MNAARIRQIVEVLFQGDPPEHEGPEPLNRRFNWVNPATGKRPPKPPKAMLPTKKDFDSLEPTHASVAGGVSTPASVPIQTPDPDRVGQHSLDDLIPKNELATIDDLLDQYLARQRAEGPDAARNWFNRYRPEFESVVRKIVDSMLG